MFRLILSVIAAVLFFGQMHGYVPVGDWRYYNNYAFARQKVIETRGKVFFLSDNNLFSYDKTSGEMYGYSHRTELSDIIVTGIFYDPVHDMVAAVYDNGNIDFISREGDIRNVSGIKDALYIDNRTVNDIGFCGKTCFVAGAFGIVEISLESFTVKESVITEGEVTAIAAADEYIIYNTGDKFMLKDRRKPLASGEGTKLLCELKSTSVSISGDDTLVSVDGRRMYRLKFDPVACSVDEVEEWSVGAGYIVASGNALFVSGKDSYALVTPDGDVTVKALPESIKKSEVVKYHGLVPDGSFWFIDSDGLGHCKADGNGGTATVDVRPGRPMATFLDGGAWYITADEITGKIYVSNRSSRNGISYYNENGRMSVTGITDGFARNITPACTSSYLGNGNSSGILKNGFNIAVDRGESDVIYIGTWFEGILKIRNGNLVDKYDWNNMPLPLNYVHAFPAVALDYDNNLWCYGYNASGEVITAVLPVTKRKDKNVKTDDWIVLYRDKFSAFDSRNSIILPCRKRDAVIVSEGHNEHRLTIYDTGNGVSPLMRSNTVNTFIDQDGKMFGPLNIYCMAEDDDGKVWVGTSDGVFVIHDPVDMFGHEVEVERVKVPRQDGTNYADYLLGNRDVTALAVDKANRKWFGTQGSGLYLVSADGKEIIDNFTIDNSYLTSNDILSVACSPTDNSVFVGTEHGLLEYGSDSSEGESDYSQVRVFPNPVRPEYAGPVTIDNLKDNSLVKIINSAGNPVYQTRSNGGMAVWEKAHGVASGIYFIVVSSPDGNDGEVVAKIMVVN